jgi:hypothetical protein
MADFDHVGVKVVAGCDEPSFARFAGVTHE